MKRFFTDRVKTSLTIDCNYAMDVNPGNDFVYIQPPTPIISSFITLLSFNAFGIRPGSSSGNAKHKVKLSKSDVAFSQPKTEASQSKVVFSQPKEDGTTHIFVNKHTKYLLTKSKVNIN
jgi:hypothetical protein